ncbi:hypothetical protein Cni_G08419 [Canna indica]|uniref:Uncharacterized protein n=1 Tax=Canna indica TaxID=4628 RepID=A0AAQ3K2V5_9LILI|nr:hypothetical protein Cni_G08419 [Canna indica]
MPIHPGKVWLPSSKLPSQTLDFLCAKDNIRETRSYEEFPWSNSMRESQHGNHESGLCLLETTPQADISIVLVQQFVSEVAKVLCDKMALILSQMPCKTDMNDCWNDSTIKPC